MKARKDNQRGWGSSAAADARAGVCGRVVVIATNIAHRYTASDSLRKYDEKRITRATVPAVAVPRRT
jgi:hypothetical protein